MELTETIGLLLTLAALFAYLNYKYFRLPMAIGIMAISLAFSLALILLAIPLHIEPLVQSILGEIDFNKTLMEGMLSYLLFAGALHINLSDLLKQRAIVGLLATIGVIGSTFIVGSLMFLLLAELDLYIPFIHCLIFGALISPTDPIAVMGILKTAGAPKSLESKIAGESLFNDGIGVVVFLTLTGLAFGRSEMDALSISTLFFQEVVGGALLGGILGWGAYSLIKRVDQYQVEILLTLSLVSGGYSLAHALHVSGPIAIVVAGLLIGNHGRSFGMSQATRDHLDGFWNLIDEILNAVLFVLIGLEIIIITVELEFFVAGLLAIPVALLARLICVSITIQVLKFKRKFTQGALTILTWGGLRGGISVALALSLPQGPNREVIVTMTYIVVIFSILVQGLTIGKLVKKMVGTRAAGRPSV